MAVKPSEWQVALKDFNKKKLKEPIFIITDVTPEDADFLLEDNRHNRHLNKTRVASYQKMMEEGKWQLNGETLKITSNAILMDGQHRLAALKKANKPIRMAMALGVSMEAFAVTDTGKSRGGGDILAIAGYKNAIANAAAIRYMCLYNRTESINGCYGANLTPADLLEGIQRWPHIRDYVYPAINLKGIATPSLIQFLMYVFHHIDDDKAYTFFERLETGARLGKTSPILHLRELLLSHSVASTRLNKHAMLAHIILAWNAYYEGRRVSEIKYTGAPFPKISGVNRKKLLSKFSGKGEYKEEQ